DRLLRPEVEERLQEGGVLLHLAPPGPSRDDHEIAVCEVPSDVMGEELHAESARDVLLEGSESDDEVEGRMELLRFRAALVRDAVRLHGARVLETTHLDDLNHELNVSVFPLVEAKADDPVGHVLHQAVSRRARG